MLRRGDQVQVLAEHSPVSPSQPLVLLNTISLIPTPCCHCTTSYRPTLHLFKQNFVAPHAIQLLDWVPQDILSALQAYLWSATGNQGRSASAQQIPSTAAADQGESDTTASPGDSVRLGMHRCCLCGSTADHARLVAVLQQQQQQRASAPSPTKNSAAASARTVHQPSPLCSTGMASPEVMQALGSQPNLAARTRRKPREPTGMWWCRLAYAACVGHWSTQPPSPQEPTCHPSFVLYSKPCQHSPRTADHPSGPARQQPRDRRCRRRPQHVTATAACGRSSSTAPAPAAAHACWGRSRRRRRRHRQQRQRE